MAKKPNMVREPVQVYLDSHDRGLLEALARHSALSRAELLRLGLRRLSEEMLTHGHPGSSSDVLVGALDASLTVPTDLAARHDDYLYGEASEEKPRASKAKR